MIDEPTTAHLNMPLGVTGSVRNLTLSNIQAIDRGHNRGSWFQPNRIAGEVLEGHLSIVIGKLKSE